MTGKFITFEGIDGAGKSTHIGFVSDFIRARGIELVSTREPGGTPLGERIRELFLHEKMHLETEALLVFASRREHVDKVIAPALQRGAWVLSDRFTDASFAYQSGGRGLDRDKLQVLADWVHGDLAPDLTLLFDVPLDVARARLDATRELDKFEREQADFFHATRNEYLRRAAEFPARFRVIDSSQSIAAIQQQLVGILESFMQ